MNERIDSTPSAALERLEAIESLVPQRLPIRLVEELRKVEGDEAHTWAVVRSSWPTVQQGHARTIVLIELIAQSAAALMGWRARHQEAAEPPGMLVGVPSAAWSRPVIPVGTPLLTHVRITRGFSRFAAFEGRVCDEAGQLWMEASIQAYRPTQDELVDGGICPSGAKSANTPEGAPAEERRT